MYREFRAVLSAVCWMLGVVLLLCAIGSGIEAAALTASCCIIAIGVILLPRDITAGLHCAAGTSNPAAVGALIELLPESSQQQQEILQAALIRLFPLAETGSLTRRQRSALLDPIAMADPERDAEFLLAALGWMALAGQACWLFAAECLRRRSSGEVAEAAEECILQIQRVMDLRLQSGGLLRPAVGYCAQIALLRPARDAGIAQAELVRPIPQTVDAGSPSPD